jgi:hypothetical protein
MVNAGEAALRFNSMVPGEIMARPARKGKNSHQKLSNETSQVAAANTGRAT